MKEKGKAITNIIIAGILFLNAILTAKGTNPFPIDENEITETISYIVAGLDAVWIWWKNQNMTIEAQTAQKIMNEMKQNRNEVGGEGDPLEVQ